MAATTRNEEALADKFELHELSAAAKADAGERTATVREAFRTHRKAVFWSMALSAA